MRLATLLLLSLTVLTGNVLAEVTPSDDLVGRQVITTQPAEFRTGQTVVQTSELDLELFTVAKVNGPWLKIDDRQGWIFAKHVVLVGEGKSVMLVPTRCGNYHNETKEWLNGNWPMNEALLVDTPVPNQTDKVRTCVGLALCEFAAYEFEQVAGEPANVRMLAKSNLPRRVWISCPALEDRRAPVTAEECRIINYASGPLQPKTATSNQRFTPPKSEEE